LLVTPSDLALDENLWAARWAKVGVDIRCVRRSLTEHRLRTRELPLGNRREGWIKLNSDLPDKGHIAHSKRHVEKWGDAMPGAFGFQIGRSKNSRSSPTPL
jgi:hypothetical protein